MRSIFFKPSVDQRPHGSLNIACMFGAIGLALMLSVQGAAAQSVTLVHAFTGADGADPSVSLIDGHDGSFYGVTTVGTQAGGGSNMFKIGSDGSFSVMSPLPDGFTVTAPQTLIQGIDGNFYVSAMGLAPSIFKVTSDGTVSLLHAFSSGDDFPAALVQAADGNFYGTTERGGAGFGTTFRMADDGTVTTLHEFTGDSDGGYPEGPLIQAIDGNLYGVAQLGGNKSCNSVGCGVIFRMTLAGIVTAVYQFSGGADGAFPTVALVQAEDGDLYGVTTNGGNTLCNPPFGCGTAFRMDPSGAVAPLHAFGDGADGANRFFSSSSLIQSTNGKFYGTSWAGGDVSCEPEFGCGVIFEMTPSGSVNVLHKFTGGQDGAFPHINLIQTDDGSLYGTTSIGVVATDKGTVFKLSFSTALTIRTQPQGQTVTWGDSANLNIAVSSNVPVTYQWYIGERGNTTFPVAGATLSSYSPSVNRTTSYWVRVSSSAGSVDSASATVATRPGLWWDPQDRTIAPGGSAQLHVEAFGGGSLTYQWYLGPSGTTTNPVQFGTYPIYYTPQLTRTVTYWVRVSDEFGSVDSPAVRITVALGRNLRRQDLVADFGDGAGIWLRESATGNWQQLHSLSAKHMVTGDLDGNGVDDVVIDFGAPYGIWVWANNASWYELHASTSTHLAIGDLDGDGRADVIVDFPGVGIWVWSDNAFWYRLHSANANTIVVGDLDGNGQQEAIVDFPGAGIWAWKNNTVWVQLDPLSPTLMTVGDYDSNGQDDLIVDFANHGLWKYANDTSWSLMHPLDAVHVASGQVSGSGSDLVVDFGSSYGIWMMNFAGWLQIHSSTSTNLQVADLNGNENADVIVDFGANGLWEYTFAPLFGGPHWKQLHPLSPRLLVFGHLTGR